MRGIQYDLVFVHCAVTHSEQLRKIYKGTLKYLKNYYYIIFIINLNCKQKYSNIYPTVLQFNILIQAKRKMYLSVIL
jgi:hypothetical protein